MQEKDECIFEQLAREACWQLFEAFRISENDLHGMIPIAALLSLGKVKFEPQIFPNNLFKIQKKNGQSLDHNPYFQSKISRFFLVYEGSGLSISTTLVSDL